MEKGHGGKYGEGHDKHVFKQLLRADPALCECFGFGQFLLGFKLGAPCAVGEKTFGQRLEEREEFGEKREHHRPSLSP